MAINIQKVSTSGAVSSGSWVDVANPTVGVVGPKPNIIRAVGFFALGLLLGRT